MRVCGLRGWSWGWLRGGGKEVLLRTAAAAGRSFATGQARAGDDAFVSVLDACGGNRGLCAAAAGCGVATQQAGVGGQCCVMVLLHECIDRIMC